MHLRHLFVLLAVGCSGPDDKDSGDTDGGPPNIQFVSSSVATDFQATVSEDAIAAHRISSTLIAATSIVVADEKVQDKLNTDGGGDSAGFRASQLDCWTRPQFPMMSFPLDYSGCSAYDMEGGVFVEDHPSGPVLFNFENFTISSGTTTRGIRGALALDVRGAYPSPLYWRAFNTDGTNPDHETAPADQAQIGVELDKVTYNLYYDGGASIDFLNQQWSMWGVMTTTGESGPISVVHGARSPEEISSDEPTGPDVLKSSLNWLACRCPTSGVSAYDMPLAFTEVTIDLDDLEVEPDEIDDPLVVVPVDHEVRGRGILEHTGCGTYDVSYESEPLTVPVEKDMLASRIQFMCDTLAMADGERCAAFVVAARGLQGDLQLEVSAEEADRIALLAVDAEFDTSWCMLE